jgi:hypothetical protein
MTYQEFLNKWNNKSLDFDGYYGYQCMDLWQQYNKDVVGGPHIPAPYAKDVWEKNLYPKDKYIKISNTPDGVPQKGDVVIWAGAANGGAGHIAVFYQGDVWKFTSFDQNWNGSYCHFQSHNYNYVLGWLRPKIIAPTPTPTPQNPNDILVDKISKILQEPIDGNTKIAKIREILR